jgi:Fic family protein
LAKFIHLLKDWPSFVWDSAAIMEPLAAVRFRQGALLGKVAALGFPAQDEATLDTLTLEVVKSGEIEGERLPTDQVRSSLARRLGLDTGGLVPADRHVDGMVEMMLDATQHYEKPLTPERLFGWQAAMFPTGRSGMYEIVTGAWRDDLTGPMQVVSGAMGKERVHFEAPAAKRLPREMKKFLDWFNKNKGLNAVLKSALAHLWFVTVHPFDDGNGRIARAISDMQLARADGSHRRFYSMSAQIRLERNDYYEILENTQRGTMDVTRWLSWFLTCLNRALTLSESHLQGVMQKAEFWDKHRSVALNDRQRKMLAALFDNFEGKLTSTKWAKMTHSSHDTALRDIHDLVEKQVLKKDEGGGRSTSYRLSL